MMQAVVKTSAGRVDLSLAGLLIPSIQAEPLPISPILPAPCTEACPAGINVKAYVSLIGEGRHGEALETIRRRCPLPGICGRICHHPCEAACRRGQVEEAVAIRALKRFVADQERDFPEPLAQPLRSGAPRIAVIGSGPAGLTAAYDLRMAGIPVTLYEAESEPGGMLRYGITEYRLPRDVLDAEIEVLLHAGIDLEVGRRLGVDLDIEELLLGGFEAVLLAVGAQKGRRLGLDHEDDVRGVEDALAFLRRVNTGERRPIQGRVLVIGGGSTAVEAARSAKRLGASSVEIIYRRYREELLAAGEEIEAAEAEGIAFRFLLAPDHLLVHEDQVAGLQCLQVGLGEPDGSGRRRPILVPGTETLLEAELILAAVGQVADLGFLPEQVSERLIRRGRLAPDPDTAMTDLGGVFAAGDAVTGPATVIDAIAAGHRAAESIRHYLEEGQPAIREQRPERRAAPELGLPDPVPISDGRVRPPLRMPEPDQEFVEVERCMTGEEAEREARRCLRCGPCGDCRICVPSCGRRHLMVRVEGENGGARTVLLRGSGQVAGALRVASPARGELLTEVRPGTLKDFGDAGGVSVEVLPARTRVEESRCRSCGRCLDVCEFDALHLGEDGPIELEPSLCRGCGLCVGVCPTGTLVPSTLAPEWWSPRITGSIASDADGSDRLVVLACQRRAGALDTEIPSGTTVAEVIRLRCVGQLDAGLLIDLVARGAQRLLVAGCREGRCRFEQGSGMAELQLQRARKILGDLGHDPDRVVGDFSPDRVGDPLAPVVERFANLSCGEVHDVIGGRQDE